MKSFVIYDSYFGNTEKIAKAIGQELRAEAMNVRDIKIGSAKNLDLLVVGSPTRAFQASPAIKSFLNKLPSGFLSGVKVAAFDTGISESDTPVKILKLGIKYFGYAAQKIAKQMLKKGGELAMEPVGFFVTDTKGPLKEKEIERARKWASELDRKACLEKLS